LCVEGGMDTREEGRQEFIERYGNMIWELATKGRTEVAKLLTTKSLRK